MISKIKKSNKKNNINQTLFQALRPLYQISSIVGLAPYIQTDDKIYINNLAVILKSLITIINHGLISYLMRSYVKLGTGSSMLDRMLNIQDSTWNYLVFIHMLIEFLNRNKIVDLFAKLKKFDTYINEIMDLQESYKNVKKLTFISIVILLFVVSWSIYFDYIIYFQLDLIVFLLSLLSYHAFIATIGVFALKVVIINYLIIQRFKLINKYLVKSRIKFSDSQVSNLNSAHLFYLYYFYYNHFIYEYCKRICIYK